MISTRLLRVALAFAALVAVAAGAVFLAGYDPVATIVAIGKGTGITSLLPGVSAAERASGVRNLQQVLLITTPLVLTALAVAVPLRGGTFNIGGQGQYIVGSLAAVAVGSAFAGVPGPLLVLLAVLVAMAAGAAWAAIAALLKLLAGANEVITTIMLSWIAIFGGQWLVAVGGPLHGSDPALPRSVPIVAAAHLAPLWGRSQPVHAGIMIALLAVLGCWFLLRRTSFGFGLRAVGLNPEAAWIAGMPVTRTILVSFALGGGLAGAAGAMDVLGWKFQLTGTELALTSGLAFMGIAVATLARGSMLAILVASFAFASLAVGTSTRNLDATIFPAELAGNLATIIQAVVILLAAVLGARSVARTRSVSAATSAPTERAAGEL